MDRYLLIFILIFNLNCKTNQEDASHIPVDTIDKTTFNGTFRDFGQIHITKVSSSIFFPKTRKEVKALIQEAINNNKKIKIKGKSHSMNGSTVPYNYEWWLRTDSLNYYSFDKEGSINVGAGMRIHDILPVLLKYGYNLPVIPGGGTGITVGGFISAGGFDRGLEEWRAPYGGFWENVEKITLVDGNARIHNVTKKDFLFSYLFGSMGQLGVIVDVELKIVKDPNYMTENIYPFNEKGIISDGYFEKTYPNDNDVVYGKLFESMFWYSFFGDIDKKQEILNDLNFLKQYHLQNSESEVQYNFKGFNIPIINFQPPLVYPKDEAFFGCALQVFHKKRANSENGVIQDMYEIAKKIGLEKGYSRYIQAEYFPKSPLEYEMYFGKEIYSTFFQLKKKYDNNNVLNPNVVFPNYND